MAAILRLTLQEVMRRKIFLVVALLTMGFLILYGVALHFAARDFVLHQGNMFRLVVYPQLLSMGLYFASMLVSLLAIFAAVGTISSEVDTGILHSIVPKPIKRREIILGKFVGYSLILIVYTAILFLAVVGLVQLITGYNTGNAGLALLYFLLLPLTLLALTMLGSTMLSTMANGIAVFMLYSIGTVGGMMEQIGFMMKNVALTNIGIISSLIIPTDAIYRKMITNVLLSGKNPLNVLGDGPFGSQHPPSTAMVIYTVIYLILALWGAKAIFEKRDI